MSVTPTAFMVKNGREVQQLFAFKVRTEEPLLTPDATVVLSDGKVEWRATLGASERPREITGRIEVTRTLQTRSLQAWISAGDRELAPKQSVIQKPIREWKLFYFISPHIDLGYTDLVANVEKQLKKMNVDAFQHLATMSAHAAEYRPHWTSESSWFLELSLNDLTETAERDWKKLLAAGQISVGALDFNLHTESASPEELIRSLFRARRLAKAYPGLEAQVAIQSDVPGHAVGLVQVLRHSGIRYLAITANQGPVATLRGDFPSQPMALNLPELFYWQAPDGSRVLTTYQHWMPYGRKSMAEEEEQLKHRLMALEDSLYPYDALLIRVVGRDNGLPSVEMNKLAQAWNEKYVWPQVIFCSPLDYFRHMESRFRNSIPVLRGEMNEWWTDAFPTFARETGEVRRARGLIRSAEVLASFNRVDERPSDYPFKSVAEVYDQLLRYVEHTWCLRSRGLRSRVLEKGDDTASPEWERERQAWQDKAQWAKRAGEGSRQLLRQGQENLASRVSLNQPSIIVFNPSAFARDDVVQIEWTESEPHYPRIIDPDRGLVLPSQLSNGQLFFFAAGLPALGYKSFPVVTGDPPTPASSTSKILENEFYKITLDDKLPGIRSILDKAAGQELADGTSEYRINQFIHEQYRGSERSQDMAGTALPAQVASLESFEISWGQVFDQLTWIASFREGRRSPTRIEQTAILYHPLKRIDFVNRILNKKPTAAAEAVYFSFPFRFSDFSIRCENSGAVFDPFEETLPGANRNWFSIGRWAVLQNDERFVAISPLEAPLMEFGAIRTLRLGDMPYYRPDRSHVYSYALGNLLGTRLWQEGDFVFSYTLTSGEKREALKQANRISESLHVPMVGVRAAPKKGDLPSSGQLIDLTGTEVTLLAFKAAENGNGYVLRVQENEGQARVLRIRPGLLDLRSVTLATALEEPVRPVPVSSEGIRVPLGSYEILTLRIEP